MKNTTDFIKRHPLPLYFTLVLILSWGVFLAIFGSKGIPVPADQKAMIGMIGLFGPTIAGLLMTGLVAGKAGIRVLLSRLLKWKVSLRWYAVALLTAPLTTAVVLLPLGLISPQYVPDIFKSNDSASLILFGIIVGLIFGIFEEIGWTGFAIPRMRARYSILSTGLILGIIWGFWHFLLFWESDSFAGAIPLALLLVRLFSWLPAFRILMVWVYDRTESLLVVMLMHASLVFITVTINSPLTEAGLMVSLLLRAAVMWILVGVVTFASRKNLKSAEPARLPGTAS